MTSEPSITVLLIEDNEMDAQLIKNTFRDAKVQVVHAKNLAVAHKAAECDAILLDLMLSSVTDPATGSRLEGTLGVDSVRQCRAGFPNKPIIVLTHMSDAQIQAECMQAGADYFFVKGEQSAGTILRSLSAAMEAFAIRISIRGEIAATKKYIAEAMPIIEHSRTLLKCAEERLLDLERKDG
jgi:CheY-like chemotaxis protein